MKNKHLVLLFLLVVTGGLLCRNLSWFRQSVWSRRLVKADTAAIDRIVLRQADLSEFSFVRTESGWLAMQEGRSVGVPTAVVDSLLSALPGIASLRTVHSKRPDTLGFNQGIIAQFWRQTTLLDEFRLGSELQENGQPATFLALDGHEGVYVVSGHLRGLFSKNLAQFRSKTAFRIEAATIRSVALQCPDSAEQKWTRADSLPVWRHATDSLRNCPAEAAGHWFQLLSRLNQLEFADGFDDSQADRQEFARLILEPADSQAEPLELRFFHVLPPDLPEDPGALRKTKKGISPWVLHSSQNPFNYFALEDSVLAIRIARGLLK